ncbi:MAG: hypothetical protein PHH37_03885 [Paludibacter sp.]|nr:hypothetical protein [Paludibacter sp.]
MIIIPKIMYCDFENTSKLNIKREIKNEIKIFSPPILGTKPIWDVLLLGFTTKFFFFAILITTGMKPSPIKKETMAVKYGNWQII